MKRLAPTILLALLASGCPPEKPEVISSTVAGDEAQVVVVVDDESFTLDDVKQRLDPLPEFAAARYSTTERKKTYLATMVQFELLHDDAQRLGYDKSPEATHRFEKAYVDAWIDEQVRAQPMSGDDLKAHFDANPDKYRRGTGRVTYILQTHSQERANELRSRIVEGEDTSIIERFREQAEHFSLDFPSRNNRGLVGAVTENGEFAAGDDSGFYRVSDESTGEFEEVVWKLEEETVSQPVEMAGRWLLVVWSGTIPPEDVSFDSVADEIRQDLRAQRREALLAKYAP